MRLSTEAAVVGSHQHIEAFDIKHVAELIRGIQGIDMVFAAIGVVFGPVDIVIRVDIP